MCIGSPNARPAVAGGLEWLKFWGSESGVDRWQTNPFGLTFGCMARLCGDTDRGRKIAHGKNNSHWPLAYPRIGTESNQ